MFIIDDIINGIGSWIAAGQQQEAAKKAMGISDQIWVDQRNTQKPWIGAGQTGLQGLLDLLKTSPNVDPSKIADSPAFQFRLSEGQKALERSAAARGGLGSGKFMKDLSRFSQGLASEEYGNEWNRRQADYGNHWGRLFGLAGMGQNAANTLGMFGNAQAERLLNLYGAQGNAQAAGTKGLTQGAAGAVQSLGNLATLGMGGGFSGLGGGGTTLVPTQASGYVPTQNFNLPQLAFGGR